MQNFENHIITKLPVLQFSKITVKLIDEELNSKIAWLAQEKKDLSSYYQRIYVIN